ncbi:hypothetical protein F4780DRAFT_439004 [Xylariomycetidae sp. FL0641]|nr:hypothetical protein F4780DRAFT_439004 [Xylariomycetidae sp. FL0641]
MAAKISLPIREDMRPMRNRPCRRRHRPLLFLTLGAIVLICLFGFPPSFLGRQLGLSPSSSATTATTTTTTTADADDHELVPLEAHIMSKCPDAKDCLRDMVLPTMMRVLDKVNFTLSYIGTPTENDGVDCMHGPSECLGDILELCAHHLYPDPKIWLGFTMCLTRDYPHIPQRELVEDCALEHAIDFARLNECAAKDDGAFGLSMLRDSVMRTADVGSALLLTRAFY